MLAQSARQLQIDGYLWRWSQLRKSQILQKEALTCGGRGIRTPGDLHPEATQGRPEVSPGEASGGLSWGFPNPLSVQ